MIRSATAADLAAIKTLMADNQDTIIPRSDDDILEHLPTTWIAEEKGRIVGCCCLEVYSTKICEIRTLIVDRRARRHKIGTHLVEAAVTEARKRNIPQILAITSVPQFFEKLDFGPDLQEKFAMFWHGPSKSK